MLPIPVEILPIAQEDVDRALIYIAANDPAAADRMLEELLAALDQVSHFPSSAFISSPCFLPVILPVLF